MTDPIWTPIINWLDLYNQQRPPHLFESIDAENSVTHIPNQILRPFRLYPATTTTAAPDLIEQFLRPFIEPFQREIEKVRIKLSFRYLSLDE